MTTAIDHFTSIGEPYLVVSSLDDSPFCDLVWKLARSESLIVRQVRGEKMETDAALFDEFAAAFQFPYYFGENWAAFDECMSDLSWLPGDAYLVVITEADQVLASETPDSLSRLTRMLRDVALGWAGNNPSLAVMGRKPTPFHVLMQVTAVDRASIIEKLAESGPVIAFEDFVAD